MSMRPTEYLLIKDCILTLICLCPLSPPSSSLGDSSGDDGGGGGGVNDDDVDG